MTAGKNGAAGRGAFDPDGDTRHTAELRLYPVNTRGTLYSGKEARMYLMAAILGLAGSDTSAHPDGAMCPYCGRMTAQHEPDGSCPDDWEEG